MVSLPLQTQHESRAPKTLSEVSCFPGDALAATKRHLGRPSHAGLHEPCWSEFHVRGESLYLRFGGLSAAKPLARTCQHSLIASSKSPLALLHIAHHVAAMFAGLLHVDVPLSRSPSSWRALRSHKPCRIAHTDLIYMMQCVHHRRCTMASLSWPHPSWLINSRMLRKSLGRCGVHRKHCTNLAESVVNPRQLEAVPQSLWLEYAGTSWCACLDLYVLADKQRLLARYQSNNSCGPDFNVLTGCRPASVQCPAWYASTRGGSCGRSDQPRFKERAIAMSVKLRARKRTPLQEAAGGWLVIAATKQGMQQA